MIVLDQSSLPLSQGQSLSERAELALRISAMLGTFWGPDDTADEIRAIELETWLDTLGDMTCDQFRDAWITYQRTGPRTAKGRLYKPDAGAIWRLVNTTPANTRNDAAAMWAAAIKSGAYVSEMAMTARMIDEMLGRKLVTNEDLRARGIR